MSSTANLIAKITANSTLIDSKLTTLTALVAKAKVTLDEQVLKEKNALENENETLKKEINHLVSELNRIEGKKSTDPSGPVFVEKKQVEKKVQQSQPPPSATNQSSTAKPTTTTTTTDKPATQGTKKESAKGDSGKKDQAKGTNDDRPVDISRLDLRVGKIVSAKRHPDADALYVEEVDLGEEKPRTVISGLVKFVPLEQMQNRMALLLCNLKPAKMRGILSEAMVMCASTPEKVEILLPPENAKIGDRVSVAGYPGEPDTQLNPKKKIWEEVAPHLTVNANGIACYKGVPLTVTGSGGEFKAATLTNVQVK